MAQYTGEPKGTVNKTINEMTTNTPGHANSFNPYWRQIVDNDAELEKRVNDHKNAAVLDHPDGSVTTSKLADGAVTTSKLANGSVSSSKLASGAVTDTAIGNRTISDSSAPSGDSGTLTTLLGWLANMIKAITGKSNWRTAPATTLEAAKSHMDATTGVHGATSAATPNTLVQRDSAGRFKAAAPAASDDVARKDTVDSAISSHVGASDPHSQYAKKAGDTFTGEVNFNAPIYARGDFPIFMIGIGSDTANKRNYRWDISGQRLFLQALDDSLSFVRHLFEIYHDGTIFRFNGNDVWHAGNLPHETGNWTPDLRFGGSNAGITYTSQMGYYIRVGNLVYWTFGITLSSRGVAAGNAEIRGLPFNVRPGPGFFHNVSVAKNITVPSGQWLASSVGNRSVYLYTSDDSYLTSSAFSNGSEIYASGVYITY